jgi:hypothetical protein
VFRNFLERFAGSLAGACKFRARGVDRWRHPAGTHARRPLGTRNRQLRRRIHEFRPVSRLYLVLPLNGLENAHDSRTQNNGNFRATKEAIRTAKLSGFHICIETTIFPSSDKSEVLELAKFISTLDVDGWIHKCPMAVTNNEAATEALRSARDLIPSRYWRTFSALLDLPSTLAQPGFEKKRSANSVIETVEKTPTRDATVAGDEGLRAL